MSKSEVQIGGETVVLRAPRLIYCIEATGLAEINAARGILACLALAWQAGPSKGAPAARLDRCGWNVGKFADLVAEELLRGRKMSLAELAAAGEAARLLMVSAIITETEVKAIQDFGEGLPDSSTR